MSQTKLVEVYVARGGMEAQVIKSLLESYGIPCFLKAQTAQSVHVFAVDGLGQTSVMVRPEDEADARELVKGEDNA